MRRPSLGWTRPNCLFFRQKERRLGSRRGAARTRGGREHRYEIRRGARHDVVRVRQKICSYAAIFRDLQDSMKAPTCWIVVGSRATVMPR